MNIIDRRDAIKTLAATIGAATFGLPAFAANTETKSTDLDEIKPKPLPFDPKKLHGISEKLILSHWENNYSGAVKTLNTVTKKVAMAIADKDFPAFTFNGLKREHLMRTGSVVYHDLYFGNLGGNGKIGGGIEKAINQSFGGVNNWETEFRRIAQGLAGGSGWVVLGYNFHVKRLETYWLADHMHSAPASAPLLIMDMYEHSYQLDYGAAAMKYIDAFFQNIHWEIVEARWEKTKNWDLS